MIETVVLLAALAAAAVCLAVQVWQWRRDVLWGPYIRREERGPLAG